MPNIVIQKSSATRLQVNHWELQSMGSQIHRIWRHSSLRLTKWKLWSSLTLPSSLMPQSMVVQQEERNPRHKLIRLLASHFKATSKQFWAGQCFQSDLFYHARSLFPRHINRYVNYQSNTCYKALPVSHQTSSCPVRVWSSLVSKSFNCPRPHTTTCEHL